MTPSRPLLVFCLAAVSSTAGLASQRSITSPKAYLGHQIGADHFLANYTQLTGYWRKLAAESDRMILEEIGETSYGQTMRIAVISSPENLARIDSYRDTSRRLCLARGLSEEQARTLCSEGRAVVWIDAGMHATESVAAQNILELVYRMNAGSDPEVNNILDNVVLLVCPANPDGMEMIANAYMATREVGKIPVLYQRYLGHDNNRDFYMSSMRETEAINRVLYRRWYPQIVYNHHQTAPRGTIIFTPPFRDPFNYHVDPLVVRGIELVAAHMNARLAWEGKRGVISRSGAPYSTWWNGGLRTTSYFHNMIGILTESFGSPNPTPLKQTLRRRLPSGDYPMPVASQQWHARQTIEYLQTANFAILDLAARYREELLWSFYQMGQNAIAAGSRDHWTPTPHLLAEAERRESAEQTGAAEAAAEISAEPEAEPGQVDTFADPALRDPRAFILSSDQPDFAAATRFANVLIKTGVEVHRATRDFEVQGARYSAGSWVVFAAQAFRAHVMDMFEPQWHPHDIGAGGDPVRPYDSAGWTPALSMDVQVDRVLDGVVGPFELVDGAAARPAGSVQPGTAGYLMSHADSSGYIATNRLLGAGEKVYWLEERWRNATASHPKGTVFVAAGDRTPARLETLARELGLQFSGVDETPGVSMRRLRAPRIGLFDVYGGNMPTGWTQWVLEQFEFPVELVFGQRIHDGKLRDDFDALIFHTGLRVPRPAGESERRGRRRGRSRQPSAEELEKMIAALPPFEDWSTAADRLVRLDVKKAVPALRAFAEDGGVLLGLGSQAHALIRLLELPVEVGTTTTGEDGKQRRTTRSEFYIPTSLVRAHVDTDHVLGYGASPELAMVFGGRSPVFRVEPEEESVDVVARYARDDILMSGWAVGAEHLEDRAAVLMVRLGKGKVCLYGADVVFRGQPQGSFKLLFNAILGGAGVVESVR